jgi:ribosomal protein S18 acetylase RimI-like enzyme
MSSRLAQVPKNVPKNAPEIRVRRAARGDVDALVALEHRVFASDRLSRRSLQRFLRSPTAEVIVAEGGARVFSGKVDTCFPQKMRPNNESNVAGTAIVLFRPRSAVARLYSIAVAPPMAGRGIGAMLLAAAEASALGRDCWAMRLEVHESNAAAITRYRKSGYREFGRHRGYYEDGGDALRFEKRLVPDPAVLASAPPYFHQTTEFTCGPACMIMALAWWDSQAGSRTDSSAVSRTKFRPAPVLELQLWREATTICMGAGPGGCDPYGMAVTLRRRGLWPRVHVSAPGPYFLESAKSADQRRVMQLAQREFQREAAALEIPTLLTPVNESVLMRAFDAGGVAIVLVSGYHMIPRGKPHWIFAFGRNGRHVLVHDPAAIRDDQGMAAAAETYAVPWSACERVIRLGRDRLSAAIVIRKGPP